MGDKGIPINVLCFQVFAHGDQQLLSRTWLMDPVQIQASAATPATTRGTREREPWNGEFYACFGHSDTRNWDEARRYGFISGGGGGWYSNTLNLPSVGDRVWVKAPGYGFVGVGEVIGSRQPITAFKVLTPEGEWPALDALTGGSYHREFVADPERMEYFLPVRWIHTVALSEAVDEIGLFGNQNTVCRPVTPKWRHTVERLKERWKLNGIAAQNRMETQP